MLGAVAGGVGAVRQYGLLVLAGPWAWPLIALLAVAGLAQRSLYDHVAPVALALEAGDVPAARAAVAMIVGRATEVLDEAGIARAAIESLAESFCYGEIGRAHVCTPVPNAHLVCCLLLQKKKKNHKI